nr:PAS domain S-box protein [uncultured Methanoregula sp.]
MPSVHPACKALIFSLLVAFFTTAVCMPVHAEHAPYRILVLNSYSPGLTFSDNELAGVREAFHDEKAEFTIEYMDSKKIASADYRDLLKKSYRMKYNTTHFDAIISFDDDAFQFLLKNGESIFPGTPVFFCGVNSFNTSMIAGHPGFTGVVETLSRNETMDIAQKLQPGTERILVVTDQTTSGEINRGMIEAAAASGRFSVPVIFLDENRSGLSLEELKEKLAHAPRKSVVYYSDFYQDKNGVTYMPTEVMEEISSVSSVPIYVHGDQYLGHGAVGGKLNGGILQGKTAGQMAIRNLSGIPVSDIKVYTEGMTGYMFDEKELLRWGIPLSSIPPGSLTINHVESPLEKHWMYIAAFVLFIILETWIIILLLLNRRKRIHVEGELRSAEESLRSLISANPESVLLIKIDGTVLFSNEVAASRLGTTSKELLGKNLFDLVLPEPDEGRKQIFENLMMAEKPVRTIRTYGDRIFDTTIAPIRDPDGGITKAAALAIDITESQRLQEALRRINRKLKNLSEITRTDIERRTYLVQGYLALLETDMTEQKRSEYFNRLNQMLGDLVTAVGFSRQYQNLGEKVPVWQDVNNTFLYAISHISLGKIRHELLPAMIEIYADPLLENAFLSLVKYMTGQVEGITRIRLLSHEENGVLLLICECDGTPVPETEKARFFNPDYPEYRSLFLAMEILDVTGIPISETGDGTTGARFEIRVPSGLYRYSP